MPHDRARPELTHGSDPSGAPAEHRHQPMGGTLPDARTQSAGTYFLGRYRIVDEIGVGGMASVHLARMDGPGGFQKWVAIKKIHAHLVEDESFVQMFLDEARVAARISHPNVATVFDLGKHDDSYWIAMEYLHGEPLREVMRRTEELGSAMPPEIACRVIADAAEGLHAAHELVGKKGEKLGLVHRDVTPHNLFVTYDGVTKVVDFGIAKFSSRVSNTRAGTLKGKLAYMSPEQVHGEGIDRRTDIFALGVVLWELTTGRRLFRMENDLDTLAKVQECNVPTPSSLIRGYPVDLESIVMKALAKNRSERFNTARELSRALQSLLMRRGLFVASDEVAVYTQSIFNDRIQKRDAHLRWAAEVTSTIDVDEMLPKPALAFTHSDVEERPAVRPAAGMPATGSIAELDPPTRPPMGRRDAGIPDDLKETGPVRTAMAPAFDPSQSAASSVAASARTPPKGPPRPGLAPTQESPTRPPPPRPKIEEPEHPADGDGPTIQALPPMMEPPSRGEGAPRGVLPAPRSHPALTTPDPTDDFDPEDHDATMVAVTRGEVDPLQSPPMFPRTSPPPDVASRPAQSRPQSPPSHPSQSMPGESQFDQTAALAQTPLRDYAQPQLPRPQFPPAASGEVPFQDPFGSSAQARFSVPPQESYEYDFARAGQRADVIPRQSPRTGPNRIAGPTYQSPRYRRRPPMWVVAALSFSIALLIAGVVIAILSPPSPGSHPTPGAIVAVGGGPFSTARAAFDTVVSPQAPAIGVPHMNSAPLPVVAPPITAGSTTPPPSSPAPTPSAASSAAPTFRPAPAPVAATVPAATLKPSKPAPLGALTVVCKPKCDQIVDNGTSLGPGHIFDRPVPSGRHVLQLSANGVRKTLVVEVLPEKTTPVRMTLDK